MSDTKRKLSTKGSEAENDAGHETKTPYPNQNLNPDLSCPAELPPVAREEWNRIVSELIALGILSKFDRGPLAIYCGAYSMWAEAMQALNEFGTMIKSPNGYPVQSPWVAILNRQAEVMLRIASEFGFSPASRGRHFMYTKHISMLLDSSNEPESGGELSEPSYFGSLGVPSRNRD